MKYAGMPFGMWMLFAGSFQKQLTAVLGYDAATARAIPKKAKPQWSKRKVNQIKRIPASAYLVEHLPGFVIRLRKTGAARQDPFI